MELTIQNWAKEMVSIYTWLTIKFEFSHKYKTFLVDFIYPPQYGNDESFHRAAMAFNDKMCDTYGDNAPLFTNNEKLFTLSDNALVVCANSYFITETATFAVAFSSLGRWNPGESLVTPSRDVSNTDNNIFQLAA